MSDIDYTNMFSGYDDVQAAPVIDNSPLETGWYPLEVTSVRTSTTKNGVPRVSMRVKVFDGPDAGRSTFVDAYLGSSPYKYDEKGNQITRTDEEVAKANENVQRGMKQLLSAMSQGTGSPNGEGAEQVFSFYNVEDWAGNQFMGYVRLQSGNTNKQTGQKYPDSNSLGSSVHLTDAKNGLAIWLSKNATNNAGGSVTL